jgi:hypothetical protein
MPLKWNKQIFMLKMPKEVQVQYIQMIGCDTKRAPVARKQRRHLDDGQVTNNYDVSSGRQYPA